MITINLLSFTSNPSFTLLNIKKIVTKLLKSKYIVSLYIILSYYNETIYFDFNSFINIILFF